MRAQEVATIRQQHQSERAQMSLLATYIVTVIIGQSISVSLGLLVDRYYPASISVPVSLALYFAMFWLCWRIAVRVTEPRSPSADRPQR
jgi:ABC-type phosphate transport system auxiliary subunit